MKIWDIDLTVHGDNYAERKEDVRNKAMTFQEASSEESLSWWQVSMWQGYFKEEGKRYGLLKEFRENGIC